MKPLIRTRILRIFRPLSMFWLVGLASVLLGAAPVSETEFAEIHRMAEFGSRQYQFQLYQIYSSGQGAEKDTTTALKWLERAAKNRYGPALQDIAIRYLKGQGLPQNKFLGMQHLHEAAAQGQVGALYVLGMLRLESALSRVDRESATELIQEAARLGHPAAQTRLGLMYFLGENLQTDSHKAAQLFRSAADQGYPLGFYYLGRLYAEEGAQKTPEVFELLRKAAEGGYAPAQNDLAVLIAQEEGPPDRTPEAVAWLRKAAQQEPTARVNLWVLFQQDKVVPKSSRELAQWLDIAADQGDARAQKLLGDHYLRCEYTLPHLNAYACTQVASFWYHRAARQGFGEAQVTLGRMKLPEEPAQAYAWISLAASQASTEDQAARRILQSIPSTDRQFALRLAARLETTLTSASFTAPLRLQNSPLAARPFSPGQLSLE